MRCTPDGKTRAGSSTAQFVGVLGLVTLWLVGLCQHYVAAQDTAIDHTIAQYQRLVQRHPFDARAYYALADTYIQKARQRGDMSYFNLAEQALRKALDIAPRYGQAVRHLAYVLYSRHAFQEAAELARQAIALQPTDSHAYGVLGDAYLETGQYDQAREAYGRMLELQGDLYAYSRLSGLKSLRGDPQGAIADLTRAIQEGLEQGRPPESIAWAQWQLGNEHMALGNLVAAETQYSAALTTTPQYYRALAALAQVRVAQKRYQEAIDLYQQAIGILPLPDYVAALGDVYVKLGRSEDAAKQYALVEYIGAINTLNQVLYNRELALFYADHDLKLDAALALAQKELEVRQDIYAYDLLAWVLYKSGRPQEALLPLHEALKLGTQDARLFFHAGMVYHRLSDHVQAQQYLQRALATNPHFHLWHADLATQILAELTTQLGSGVSQETRHGH
jgi:tetratricopeptide (TPR) repeat protein